MKMAKLLVFFTVLSVAMLGVSADWLMQKDTNYMRIVPQDGVVAKSNPPSFWWPVYNYLGKGNTFKLSIWANGANDGPNGTAANWSFVTPNCFYNIQFALPVGANYTWRVSVLNFANVTTSVSDSRSFFIHSSATTFIANQNFVAETINTARPRLMMKGATKDAFLASPAGKTFVNRLNSNVYPFLKGKIGEVLPAAPNKTSADFVPGTPDWAEYLIGMQTTYTNPQVLVISNALYALWHNMSNTPLLNEVKRRVLAFLEPDPAGATSDASQDQANRGIMFSLTQSIDLLYDHFNATERTRILANIKNRTEQIYEGGAFLTKLMNAPYDSHGAGTLSYIAPASVAMLGLIPDATSWANSVHLYANMVSTWGLQDGGFGNGMGYNYYDVGNTPSRLNYIKWATGIDIWQKQWVREWPLQFIYFAPPGNSAYGGLAFGDAGMDDMHSYQLVACADLMTPLLDTFPNYEYAPLYDWYCNALKWLPGHIDYKYNDAIMSRNFSNPHDLTPGTYPDSFLLKTNGWAALHSSLSDVNRTSLFFRASRLGSYIHNHADQLCFTFAHKNQALLIASGFYDYYGSVHHKGWTIQTKSKSGAVTMDGGIGQWTNDAGANGTITQFGHTDEYDYVSGDAVTAYNFKVTSVDRQLTRATRSILFMRKTNQFLIMDQFDANAPRSFEWNIHAYKNFTVVSPTTVKSVNGDAQLCIKMLYAPVAFTFSQTDQYGVPLATKPLQAHGMFKMNSNVTSATFVVLLDPDCTGVEPKLQKSGGNWSLAVTDKVNVAWSGNGLEFSAAATSTSSSATATATASTGSAPATSASTQAATTGAADESAATNVAYSLCLIGLLLAASLL